MLMSLSVTGYMKQYYRGNVFGATSNGRAGYGPKNLLSADMKAIRRAVKDLGGYDYEEGEGSELMNKVQAFVDTYNHYVDSAKGIDDPDMKRYLTKLKKLTKENADEFSEIGITIQSSGKLKVDKKALQDTGRYQVSKLFAKDAEFSQQADLWMKRTDHMVMRKNLTATKQEPSKKTENRQAADPQALGMDAQLAQQLGLALSGNQIDYSV